MVGVINAKLVDTTNSHVKKYIGEIRSCYVSNNQLRMIREDGHGIITSTIKEYIQDGPRLTIVTSNSKYELEIIK